MLYTHMNKKHIPKNYWVHTYLQNISEIKMIKNHYFAK